MAEWQIGTGLSDILGKASPSDQPAIFRTIFEKLKAEHPSGGWPSLWESLLSAGEKFPASIPASDRSLLAGLRDAARLRTDEMNSRSNSGYTGQKVRGAGRREEEGELFVSQLVATCDPSSPASIDEALTRIENHPNLPYFAKGRFFELLRANCPYEKRLPFLLALCEVAALEIDDAIGRITDSFAEWKVSTAHLLGQAKSIVERLFEFKGSQIFDLRYASVTRQVMLLANFCGDHEFVMRLLLETVANEQVELSGEEWLQLATSLSRQASPAASLEALESMLSGPAARIADEIGEGPFRPAFGNADSEVDLLADIIWHLLGDEDTYVRWSTAKAIRALADLGLHDDIVALMDRFDVRSLEALQSTDHRLCFQNSRQWLAMGLARASLRHGQSLRGLAPGLMKLAKRPDLHVIERRQLVQSLVNIDAPGTAVEVGSLLKSVSGPPKGYLKTDRYAPAAAVKPKSGFSFDYEFTKTEISAVARLFEISQGEVVDAAGAEIARIFPEAKSMDYFPGHDRYRRERHDRYEYFREQVQKHAVIGAGTRLSQTKPVIRRSYETWEPGPWDDWLLRYDLTFRDGSFLSDHKDAMPDFANAYLLGSEKDTLKDRDILLSTVKLLGGVEADPVPIYGHWTAPDGVHVRMVSGLTDSRGAIGKCTAFSEREEHDLWIPLCDGDGEEDRHLAENPFEPLIWDPDAYNIGVDGGDELATDDAAARPRLGTGPTARLNLVPDKNLREWTNGSGETGLKSQVWGRWLPDPDDHRGRYHNNGQILWASSSLWLDKALSRLGKRLVTTVTFAKYKSGKSYDESKGVKAVYVLLRAADGTARIWHAKRASAETSY